MANYDQSGNPIGGRQRSAGNPQGGTQAGTGQGGESGRQQSQYAGTGAGPYRGNEGMPQQGAGRGMQASPGATGRYGGGLFPDVYGGMGAGPFQLISRLSEEMDRLFDSFGMGAVAPDRGQHRTSGQGGQGVGALWAPHIEIAERDGKLLIQADLPGVRKEDLDVQVEADAEGSSDRR